MTSEGKSMKSMFGIGGCEEVWSSYWIAVCDSVSVAVV